MITSQSIAPASAGLVAANIDMFKNASQRSTTSFVTKGEPILNTQSEIRPLIVNLEVLS